MNVTRRGFLKSTGLVLGLTIAPKVLLRSAEAAVTVKEAPDPNAFLRIGADDSITVLISHSEMGQGIWTTLAMLVAEELGCDVSKMTVEHAPAAPVYAHTVFGMQMTGGSSTTWSEFDRYRKVGATAREMLIAAAAQQWGVAPGACHVDNGFVVGGGKRLSFGAVADAAHKLTPPETVTLKDAKDWKILGKPHKRLDSPEKVTGKATFGLDVRLPGMLTAVVARSPVFGGKLKSFRADKAKSIAGVKAVVQVPSGVAVVAEHFWAAKLGRDALELDWDLGAGADLDSDKLRAEQTALGVTPGAKASSAGDVDAAMKTAASTVAADYDFPYLAHATMEPLNCTVRLAPDACEIWTGTQMQTMDQMSAARVAGLKPEQVTIHTTFLGGGFGRRATPSSDFVVEAVAVAKASGGSTGAAPIKTVWTREDDMQGGYYRPMYHHHLKVGVGADGMPVAWRQTIIGQSILAGTPFESMLVKNGIDSTSVEGASDSPYVESTPAYLVDLHTTATPVPVLWWRSVGNSHTAYVMETFIDELAHHAKQDPIAYRRKLLTKKPRHQKVLDTVAAAAKAKPLPKGHFRGFAVHESFGSFVAQAADVSVEGGKIRVHRVFCAVDCGICVNPAGVEAGIQSAIAYGLTAALHGAITFKNGRVEQTNFDDYPILRMQAMPTVEVHIVPSTEKSGGIGEVGVPPVAPAVANALFLATGKRQRSLPFKLEG